MSQRAIAMRRILDASPERVYRAWSDPEAITGWFARGVEGSLAVGTRSVLIWSDRRVWLDMVEADPEERIRFRMAPSSAEMAVQETTVDLRRHGYGTLLILAEGPFRTEEPAGLDAYAQAIEGWADALANLRAQLDFSVDLRPRL